MKKKTIVILLLIAVALGVTGCGANKNEKTNSIIKAKVTDNTGNKLEITADELLDVYNENNAKFEKIYKDAEIELEGKVEKVSSNMGGWIYDIVYLENNWEILFSKDYYDLSNLEKGTKVRVKSKIAGKDPENNLNKMAIYGIRKSDSENVVFEIIQ